MDFFEKLLPHLIFAAALLPTVLLLLAAAVSLTTPEASLDISRPVEAAVSCEACRPVQGE